MNGLTLNSNSLLNQPAHRPFAQNQCCTGNGGRAHYSEPLRIKPSMMYLYSPLTSAQMIHLFYCVCSNIIWVKLQAIKWNAVVSSYKGSEENVSPSKIHRKSFDLLLPGSFCALSFLNIDMFCESIIHFHKTRRSGFDILPRLFVLSCLAGFHGS